MLQPLDDANTALTKFDTPTTSSTLTPDQPDRPIRTLTSDVRDLEFNYVAPERKPYPGMVAWMRRHIFSFFVFAVFAGTVAWLAIIYIVYIAEDMAADEFRKKYVNLLKCISVPLVALLFTWFHVWLALYMMFYPLDFYGFGKPYVPECVGLPINGWQGIVPRKAAIMAQRACDTMIGQVVSIDEITERIQPEEFVEKFEDMLGHISCETLQRLICKRWPQLWASMPEQVQAELKKTVFGEVKCAFHPGMLDLQANILHILDIKEMATETMTNNPKMMVDIFRDVARRELSFIQHVGAVMGFLLGLVQVVLYLGIKGKYADYYILPASGLIIGYFTNWLALTMTFRPILPHQYCFSYCNLQGVFLKRQPEAAAQLAELIGSKVVFANAMVEYILKAKEGAGVEKVLVIYQTHIDRAVDGSIGALHGYVPRFVKDQIEDAKKEIIEITMEILPQYTDAIAQHMDDSMNLKEILGRRLARMEPEKFENIVHPIFKDDEWILLLVGAVLGIIIGLLQAYFLQKFS